MRKCTCGLAGVSPMRAGSLGRAGLQGVDLCALFWVAPEFYFFVVPTWLSQTASALCGARTRQVSLHDVVVPTLHFKFMVFHRGAILAPKLVVVQATTLPCELLFESALCSLRRRCAAA